MADLRNPILATLAYYDIFDYPLTGLEVYERLINPARLDKSVVGLSEISLNSVTDGLENLTASHKAEVFEGFYTLPGRAEHLYNLRAERHKIAAQKFKKLLRAVRWLRPVPFLRGLFVSGSLAMSHSMPSGDFDILVITRARRLYTCRVFLSLIASLMGMRRTRHDTEAPDKFCFNHYITDNDLQIKYESIYAAQTYSHLIPVFIRDNVDEQFFASNVWLNKYFYNFRPDSQSVARKVQISKFLHGLVKFSELVLDTPMGLAIENSLRKYQQSRIRLNPATFEAGGRVVFSDTRLEFHPRSFETIVIRRYNEAIRRLNILPPLSETDSGLSK